MRGLRTLSRQPIIGVIGAGSVDASGAVLAEEVGRLIAEKGAILICGGLYGVMEAACRGAYQNGGITIGVLPGEDAGTANPYVSIPIVTGLSHARNIIIVRTAHVLIAIRGGYGTLSEISFALKMGKKVIGLETWDIESPIVRADSPTHALEEAFLYV